MEPSLPETSDSLPAGAFKRGDIVSIYRWDGPYCLAYVELPSPTFYARLYIVRPVPSNVILSAWPSKSTYLYTVESPEFRFYKPTEEEAAMYLLAQIGGN